MDVAAIQARVAEVRNRIARAAGLRRRDPADILLLAVTKTQPAETIHAAYEAGLRHFGENRVEEAVGKTLDSSLRALDDVTWHMIGHIQSRKADQVAALFSWAHSVDRLKVARRLSDAARQGGKTLNALLEVNLSGESAKSGFDLSRWPDDRQQENAFITEAQAIAGLPGLRVTGLMTMAPYSANPEDARPIFRRLRELRERLGDTVPKCDWRHLSMGMSGDFELAIEEGATIIRLGTIIFGPRERG